MRWNQQFFIGFCRRVCAVGPFRLHTTDLLRFLFWGLKIAQPTLGLRKVRVCSSCTHSTISSLRVLSGSVVRAVDLRLRLCWFKPILQRFWEFSSSNRNRVVKVFLKWNLKSYFIFFKLHLVTKSSACVKMTEHMNFNWTVWELPGERRPTNIGMAWLRIFLINNTHFSRE